MKPKKIWSLFLIYFFSMGGLVYAERPFVDPGIPHGEIITYNSHVGNKSITIIEEVSIIKDGSREFYEITSRSRTLDRTLRLVKKNMAIVSVHTIRKFHEVALDSKLTVLNEKSPIEKDEVKLADFSVVNYIFRGFPFGKLKRLQIGFYREEQQKKFSFNVKYKKRENVKLRQKVIDCHKLEFGIDGFWGTFFPKIEVWYSVETPHYMVRYEGLLGPPGSPKRIIELVTYNIIEKKISTNP